MLPNIDGPYRPPSLSLFNKGQGSKKRPTRGGHTGPNTARGPGPTADSTASAIPRPPEVPGRFYRATTTRVGTAFAELSLKRPLQTTRERRKLGHKNHRRWEFSTLIEDQVGRVFCRRIPLSRASVPTLTNSTATHRGCRPLDQPCSA